MKKRSLLLCMNFVLLLPLYTYNDFSISSEQEEKLEESVDAEQSNEFEDFFGVDETPDQGLVFQPKEKPSAIQLFFMKMGDSTVGAIDNMYAWLCAACSYVQSWVKHG